MREKDLPFDRTKHAVYTKNAKKCVQTLLRRYYDKDTAEALWEKIQLQYCAFLEEEPALGGLTNSVSVYDPILIFAWYRVIPDKVPLRDVQDDVFDCFFKPFRLLGGVFDLNRTMDNRLAAVVFRKASDVRVREIAQFPASFRMGSFEYDREDRVVRYCFTQCPNASFARRHHMEDVLPVMCNCDHYAMQLIHASLIREGTCVTADRCDYCIVGDRHPLAGEYTLVTDENGLLRSVKKR